MARLVGPDEASRLTYTMPGDNRFGSAARLPVVFYADAGATTLADIRTVDGAPVPGAEMEVAADSLLPLFQFPDGVDVVYARVGLGGGVYPVYARTSERLAQVAAQKVNLGDLTFNVKDYGAAGNNVADDTAAIQNVIDNVVPASGGTVHFPPGNYRITAPINVRNRITITGAGSLTSILRTSTQNIDMLRIIGTSSARSGPVHVRDLGLIGPGKTAGSSGNGITIEWGSTNLSFDRMYIEAMRGHGISQFETYTATYRDVFITGCGRNGFYGRKNCNHTLWARCNFLLCGEAGVRIESGTCGVFNACDFESNAGSGLELLYTNNYVVSGCELENNGASPTGSRAGIYLHWGANGSAEKAVATTITGCGITGTGVAQYGVRVDGGNLTQIMGNQILNNLGAHISVTANATRTYVGPNSYVGTPATGNLENASNTTGVLEIDTVGGTLRTPALKFDPGATPAVPSGGQLWYSDAVNRLRHRDATGSTVRDVCSGVTGTVTATAVTIPAGGTVDVSAALGGASVGQKVVTSAPVNLPAGVMPFSFVSGANAVTLRLLNTTGTAITGYTGSFLVQAIF